MSFLYESYTDKRYNAWGDYLKHFFQCKVGKVVIDAGFGCPHRDNLRGKGGCIYCSTEGAAGSINNASLSIEEQINHGKRVMSRKYKAQKFIAYFQNYSNTFGKLSDIKNVYEEALKQDDIVSLDISTRPDCLNDDIIDYLAELSERTLLWLELGLQSSNDNVLKWLNRNHTYADVVNAVERLKKKSKKINIALHLILGMPGDDEHQSIKDINQLDINGIKFHPLHILKETKLAEIYEKNPFEVLSREKYADILTDLIGELREDIFIQRLTGEASWEDIIAPEWIKYKFEALNLIEDKLLNKNIWQGEKYVTKK